MAINAQHTMYLKRVDGEWKITMHYFPGAVRKYLFGAPALPSEAEMLTSLQKEFAPLGQAAIASQIPPGTTPYNPEQAAAYAMQYTEEKNPGDMTGNCANFVSQCLSKGFAKRYTSEWFAAAVKDHRPGRQPDIFGNI